MIILNIKNGKTLSTTPIDYSHTLQPPLGVFMKIKYS